MRPDSIRHLSSPTQAKARVDLLPMFVLDVLRDDEIENVPSIVNMLNDDGCIGWRDQWDRDFTEADVRTVQGPLVRDGLLLALREKADTDGFDEIDETNLSVDDVWFHLTAAGRKAWDSWGPPGEADQ